MRSPENKKTVQHAIPDGKASLLGRRVKMVEETLCSLFLLVKEQIRPCNLNLGWYAARPPIAHALDAKRQLVTEFLCQFGWAAEAFDQCGVFFDLGIHAHILNAAFRFCQTLCLADAKQRVID